MDMVSWKDYEGVDGFGTTTQKDVDELNKALTAGQDINAPAAAPGEGFPLRVESLEATLKVVTYRSTALKFFKAIPKIPAYNTVEEHNELSSYGDNPDAAFISEGDLPESDDSTYARKYAIVKFLGTTRKVTHVMSMVKPAHGNVIASETVNGTMHLLKQVERALYYGDSTLNALSFDGFEKLLVDNAPAGNIIDLRGDPLSEDVLTDACLSAQDAPNYGQVTHCHLGPKIKADLVKTFFPKERHNTFSDKNGMIGLDVKGFTSPAGDVQFVPNVFVNDGGGPNATAFGDASKIPGAPSISTGLANNAVSNPLFTADDAGTYIYSVSACNRFGRSAAISVGAGIAVIAGDNTTFGITPGGSTVVSWYEVYRTEKDGAAGSERLILRVANGAGAGQQTITDLNTNLPGCSSVFMFQQNLESLSLKQLAPMLKIPLATIDSSIRWMQLLYCVPVLYAPGKNILIRNCGRAAGFVGQR